MGLKFMDEHGYEMRAGVRPQIAVERIYEQCGWPITSKLIAAIRGGSYQIPHNWMEMQAIVGEEAAKVLCARYPGRICQVPADTLRFVERRDSDVQRELREGVPHHALREKYGLTTEQLDRALAVVEG